MSVYYYALEECSKSVMIQSRRSSTSKVPFSPRDGCNRVGDPKRFKKRQALLLLNLFQRDMICYDGHYTLFRGWDLRGDNSSGTSATTEITY
jgi:hypothetical protein